MDLKERISYNLIDGKLVGVKTNTLRSRKMKNTQRKTVMEMIKKRKNESHVPLNYKKYEWYKKKSLKGRRQYNKTIKKIMRENPDYRYRNPEIGRVFRYDENKPIGTTLNVMPYVSLNSPLYVPNVSNEEDKILRENLKSWQRLKSEWKKTEKKRPSRKKKTKK